MATEMSTTPGGESTSRLPWFLTMAGIGTAAAALALKTIQPGELAAVRFVLLLTAHLLAASAVRLVLKRWVPDLSARLRAASLTSLAALVPLIGWFACGADWDSGQLVCVALCMVGVVGSILILLPEQPRRLVLSLLILFHFGGILSAALSPGAGGLPGPWLVTQTWLRVYRPYLGFTYLNNAYHFYSPSPGPATLIWTYIIYSKGEGPDRVRWGEWVKFPDRQTSPVTMHYQRLISLGMSLEAVINSIPDADLEVRKESRRSAGLRRGIPLDDLLIPASAQFRIPQDSTLMYLSAYARHMARTHPVRPDDPSYKFESVKIYRVTHGNIQPLQLLRGESPPDRQYYFPCYQGEYNDQGVLLDSNDPFLYWLIPYGAMPGERDYLEEHARAASSRP